MLKRAIADNKEGATATLLSKRMRVLHVKSMDKITTRKEVKSAIREATGVGPDFFEVRALWPACVERCKATVLVAKNIAQKLKELGRLRVRWVSCIIVERTEKSRCFRCCGYGHTKAGC